MPVIIYGVGIIIFCTPGDAHPNPAV